MCSYSDDPFDLEVLTEESFVDGTYTTTVIVIRLNNTAQAEWINVNNGPERDFLTWEEKILDLLDCPPDTSRSITQAQGDIFTVVTNEIDEMTDEPEAATLTDRDVTRYLWLVDRKLSLLTDREHARRGGEERDG